MWRIIRLCFIPSSHKSYIIYALGETPFMCPYYLSLSLFSFHVLIFSHELGGSKSYQQWMENLKVSFFSLLVYFLPSCVFIFSLFNILQKGGGSLILTVKSKAQMYKNVSDVSVLSCKHGVNFCIVFTVHRKCALL